MSVSAGHTQFGTFKEAYCHAFCCDSHSFVRHALVQGIPPWRRIYAVPVLWIAPATFGIDASVLAMLGRSRSKHEFSQLLDEFHNAMRVTRSWSKRWLGLRMSGARLIEIRERLDPWILPGDLPPSPTRAEAG